MCGDPEQLPAGEEIAIRLADVDDIVALTGLATWFRSDAFGTDLVAAERAAFATPSRSPAAFARALAQGVIVVAEAGGRIVGYAQFGPVTVPGARAGSADRSLDRIAVEGALHGRGVGRRLMQAALSRPELAGAPRIFLRVSEHNAGALALYSRLGFRRATARDFTTGSTPGGSPVMVLERRGRDR